MQENKRPENISELLQIKDSVLLQQAREGLGRLCIPEEDDFQGNDQLYRIAMETYIQTKQHFESEINKLSQPSEQRKIARGGLGNNFGIN